MKIEFLINDRGELYDFKTSEEEEEIEELTIPSIVKDIKVESIADLRTAFWKLYQHGVKKIGHLIIENGVEKIEEYAFTRIKIGIGTFHWPKTCPTISEGCFLESNITNVIGIEDVKEIKKCAFEKSKIRTFSWPGNCKVIPIECFCGCTKLEIIENIEQVTQIGSCAFSFTRLKKFSWPSKCKVVPWKCFFDCKFFSQISGLEEVADIYYGAFTGTALTTFGWPENVSATGIVSFLDDCDNLEEIRFEGTGIKDIDLECLGGLKNVKKIDLSRCGAVNLLNATDPQYAEDKGKLILPYYVTEIN